MRTLYLHAGMKTKYIMNIVAFYHFHEHFSIGGCHQQSNLDNLEFIQLILKFLPPLHNEVKHEKQLSNACNSITYNTLVTV